MALNLLKKEVIPIGLFAIEKLTLAYSLLTTLLILVFYSRMDHPDQMLWFRFYVTALIFLFVFVQYKFPCRLTALIRMSVPLVLLGNWYSETYEFSRMFLNLDHYLAVADQWLFGCQPSLLFCQHVTSRWVSEAFFMGYFSLFPTVAFLTLFYFFRHYRMADKETFVLLCSFFIYYLIFMFFPAVGPQFYFPAIGMDNAENGLFVAVGNYFDTHTYMLPKPGEDGMFHRFVEWSLSVGERPTAAFPSSHVGVATVMMILARKVSKKIMLFLLPFYGLLCLATVYTQAHYVVDAIFGFLTAFPVYGLAVWLYNRFFCSSLLTAVETGK